MSTISFQEASCRSEIPLGKLGELADMGYFKTVMNPFATMIDQDSFDQYLANRQPPENGKEMITVGTVKSGGKSMETVKSGFGGGEVDKIERYDWEPLDTPGIPMWIDKNELERDPDYQREPSEHKTRSIASRFKWRAFVAIGVSRRNGTFYVYDGWHRVIAARKRSDIGALLCVVFDMDTSKEEAQSFLDTNTNRRNVSSIDTFKSKIHAGDDIAEYINRILLQNGLILTKNGATAPKQISTVTALFKMAYESREDFERTMSLASELCRKCPVHSVLVTGLFHLSKSIDTPFTDPRLRKRILAIGAEELVRAANSSGAYHNHFTPKYFAEGMLSAINRHLKKQFEMRAA